MRILLADDHDIVRLGLRQLLTAHPGWEICAEAATGNEAVALSERFAPHVVVMDVGMPELNGIEATRKICKLSLSDENRYSDNAFFGSADRRNC
jgi:DNA-binding NarL/FixJ family response regulator